MPDKALALYESLDPDDPTPLPLIVAREWGFALQHHILNDEYWFSILDWIVGITGTDSTKAAKMWWKLQPKTSTSSRSLPYIASDGKTYNRDFTDDNGLYLIAAHLRVTHKRTVLNDIKKFLAAAGVLVDELRTNPETAISLGIGAIEKYERMGKDRDWIQARIEGIVSRKAFTDALKASVVDMFGSERQMYWQSTETLYKGLWERTAAQLRHELAVPPKEDIRDHFGKYALIYTGLTERIIAEKLAQAESLPWTVGLEIIWQVARMIYGQARQTAELLGYDLVTERPLLDAGSR